ncbi:SMP-30/Gluconolaconase/LRE-like region [Anatilimnocola aggregata]|uniref:SMP-30/Gluconolaconase/LRE-like region n=1 Tax=Anatilimnocola aggregata TaxID=2528021 RepID=A0A517YEC5_9BACT|nr:SMP-30/gluconolactonase/LRE family protein [Anatilimnocola aggregata]QDU28578.1 SMP-30/Gluconolaconase/LRE-like region [Anatilimnocola aggregata]
MGSRAESILLAVVVLLSSATASAQPSLQWVNGPQLVFERESQSSWVTFELNRLTDVEVALVDPASSLVVRHLAAGVLGDNPPPPLVAKSRSQKIAWDGKDDYGLPVADPAKLTVRVRAGMSVKLDRIVGGDPYAFWSELSGQGDHAQWMVTGLEAKSDGSVYVLGNSTFYGAPTIRQYDARGAYRRTVFPPPAGKPVDDVQGWGINVRDDGTYTLQSRSGWGQASPSKTLLSRGGQALCATLVPTSASDNLCLTSVAGRDFGNQQMTIGCDGTLRENQVNVMLGGEPLPTRGFSGNLFSALSSDGKSLYVSGLFANDNAQGISTTGFWRDGQVWKVDLATRKTQVFFSLDEKDVIATMKARTASSIGHTSANPYAALQGVATDAEGRVFICDRQNKRIVVLDDEGKLIREIPVAYPDAIAVNPKSQALYVTTRFGDYGGNGEMALLKFGDWTKDDAPEVSLPLRSGIGKFRENSHLAVVEDKGEMFVWVAYTTLPVRVYQDSGTSLELVKDFYEAGPQRALDLQHMEVDQKTGDVYIADAQGFCFRITDWKDPQFVLCKQDAKTPLRASSIAIDARSRHLYTHYHWGTPVYRWSMDGDFFTPAPAGVLQKESVVTIPGRPVPTVGSAHAITPPIACSWIFTGLGERGIAVAPSGGLATLGVLPDKNNRADDYSGPLHYFKPESARVPWQPLRFSGFGGQKPRSGGIRFDPRGNLYVGLHNGNVNNMPQGFDRDPDFKATTGRIYKYAPTGSVEGGTLFPKEPAAPDKVYDIHYGPLGPQSRTPRFGVDGYGRVYYPTGQLPRVSVIDNEGNPIVTFGTYGNRDSMGGLPGDLVPTKDLPMAWPNSVDATDDHIYVSDIVNVRLLRIEKQFALSMNSE